MKDIFVLLFQLVSFLPSIISESCCSVKDLNIPSNPGLSGRYLLVGHSSTLKTINSKCSTGCVYVKQGDVSDTQYCFQPSQQGKSSCSKNCEALMPPTSGDYFIFPGLIGTKLEYLIYNVAASLPPSSVASTPSAQSSMANVAFAVLSNSN